jgi:hypothetical protein
MPFTRQLMQSNTAMMTKWTLLELLFLNLLARCA